MLIGCHQKLHNHDVDLRVTIDGSYRQLSHVYFSYQIARYLGLLLLSMFFKECYLEYSPLPDNLLSRLYCTLCFAAIRLHVTHLGHQPSSVLHFKCLEQLHSKFCSNSKNFLCLNV